MSIRTHKWGVSPAQDVVWSQVAGLDPDRADRSLLMIWQGYFDESDKDGWFVLAGYLSTVERWANFAAEWAKLARKYGRVDRLGRHYFHMSEQANRKDAQEFLPSMLNEIHENAMFGKVIAFKTADYGNAVKRIVVHHNNEFLIPHGDLFRNHYLFALHVFLDDMSWLTLNKVKPFDQIDLSKDRIDLYFDERSEQKRIRDAWELFKANRNESNIFQSAPRFEDDKEFLPLQSADFSAYWIRRALTERDAPGDLAESSVFTFPHKPAKGVLYNIKIYSENGIARTLTTLNVPDGAKLLDVRKLVTSKKR